MITNNIEHKDILYDPITTAHERIFVKRSSNVHEKNDSLIYRPVGRLNKKDGLTRYGDSHVKDKTS